MQLVSIVDIMQNKIPSNTEIIIQGWVRTRRDSKLGISFLSIYDGSCFNSLQAIIYNTLYNYKTEVLHLTTGCSIRIIGKLIKNLSKNNNYEIKTKFINVLGWINNPDTYPITAKRHSIEYLREVAHLRPRTNLIGAVTRIRHTLGQAIHKFMNNKGFFWVATPLITASDTEGAGKMFRVSTLELENIQNMQSIKKIYQKDFFKKKTFLTVSGQLNIESYACALSKVYTFGPTFRAENSNTTKHLSEFWMLEPEVAFASLEDISILSEKLLKYILKVVLNERANDLNFLCDKINTNLINRLNNSINNKFIQIEYTEVINILKNSNENFKNNVSWGIDLSSEHERYLTEKYFKSIIIIKNYPKKIKAFYMRINKDNKTVASMDMIAPGIGEIIGGSQREERLDKLDIRIKEMNLNKKDYYWYRDLRNYGTVPHSGFGLGFERLILYVTGLKNIRDVIAFPRFPGNIKF